ncbi:hypothetical protein [Seonamhaeicola aphaedonensis]|uniref:Uncharacterized protein n=1 Tax=Seonamhaeicola aphaedonensis TaxID=1461338 RepID=A0A3D9H834_9FLAO|nr:hypothetical protein [Seonamhaeicola aphaedonensis]RED45654.1 hypothetical protein DFQ02_10832 [Seonamhaeicola aphaedonensis]
MENTISNKNKEKIYINGGALTNAIFICLIVSVFMGVLVLISHYQNYINDELHYYEEAISRNTSAFNYFLGNSEKTPYNKIEPFDVFDDSILSYLEKKHWGFYDILISRTPCNKDTISKIALVGQKNTSKNNLALYLTDYDKPLKLSGNTKILGQIYVPNGKVDQAYINGANGNNVKQIGIKKKSEDKFPKLEKEPVFDYSNSKTTLFKHLDTNTTIINKFDQETKVIDVNGTLDIKDISLKGNIVLISKDSLQIDHTAKLEDVLVVAPKVGVSSGFKGNLQILASERVNLEEDVLLYYPSSIYLNSIDERPVTININKNSKVIGGIVINGKTKLGVANRTLTLYENALVVGTVYCNGSSQIKGTVIGSIYTNGIHLKTKSSNYENIILNATINRDSLPENFVGPYLFDKTMNQDNYAIVKEF